jgi:hypothetical protein
MRFFSLCALYKHGPIDSLRNLQLGWSILEFFVICSPERDHAPIFDWEIPLTGLVGEILVLRWCELMSK